MRHPARRVALPALLAAALAAAPASADELRLELPVDCSQTRCSIQKLVDHDPGPGRMDYACGRLTNDGDTGTDIRVPDFATMRRGVAVLAAADGVVVRLRDGVEDVSVRKLPPGAVKGREAGNAIVVDHGDGWETQYSHLRNGSIVVRVGERVTAGRKLALIGLSGNTEFPHLNFVVRHRGRTLDPFVGLAAFAACGDPRRPLWSEKAAAALAYRPSGPLAVGFAPGPADAEVARDGGYGRPTLPSDAPALTLWADVFGVMAGDVQRFVVTAPDGGELLRREQPIPSSNILWFGASGARRPESGWRPGVHRGEYTLIRDGRPLFTMNAEIAIGE